MLCLESRRKRAVDDISLQESTSEATLDDTSVQETTSEATVPDISVGAQDSSLPYWNGSIPTCVGTHNPKHSVISHSEMLLKLCSFFC